VRADAVLAGLAESEVDAALAGTPGSVSGPGRCRHGASSPGSRRRPPRCWTPWSRATGSTRKRFGHVTWSARTGGRRGAASRYCGTARQRPGHRAAGACAASWPRSTGSGCPGCSRTAEMDLHNVTALHCPTDRAELVGRLGPGAAPLAGGTWLFSSRNWSCTPWSTSPASAGRRCGAPTPAWRSARPARSPSWPRFAAPPGWPAAALARSCCEHWPARSRSGTPPPSAATSASGCRPADDLAGRRAGRRAGAVAGERAGQAGAGDRVRAR